MRTPLSKLQEANGARFIDFAGWELPVHYGSQVDEHHAVRNSVGCFDVSHMAVLDINEQYANELLSHLLTGDVANLQIGRGRYTLMLNEEAGIIDDLIVYRRTNQSFRLVVNAGTSKSDLDWIRECEQQWCKQTNIVHRDDLCIVAVQGPQALHTVAKAFDYEGLKDLSQFEFIELNHVFIACTGYTGDAGVEVICSIEEAQELWSNVIRLGAQPAGLGARDSLRLEAGLNLYGHDMTSDTHPLESRLSWTIDERNPDRVFVGKAKLAKIRESDVERKLTGLEMIDKGIPREGHIVATSAGEGVVTSGTFSPTLGRGIALVRVPKDAKGSCQVSIRNRSLAAKLVKPPFLK